VIRDIGGVGTHPIHGGSFNSPHIQGELWGEPLDRISPQSSPYVGWGALYRAPLEQALKQNAAKAKNPNYGLFVNSVLISISSL